MAHADRSLRAAFAGDLPRVRLALLVALIPAAMVTRVFAFGPKLVNLALSETLLPLGVLFLGARLLRGRLRLPSFGVFWWAMATIVLSSSLNLQAAIANRGFIGMLVEVFKLGLLWLHFYLIVNLVETRRDFLLVLRLWMAGGACVAAAGIAGSLLWQHFGIVSRMSLMYRAQGTLGDCNLFAAHLTLSFVLGLLYRRLSGSRSFWVKLALVLDVAGIVFSASRGQLLAFSTVSGTLWLLVATPRQKVASLALGAAALACVLAIPATRGIVLHNPIVDRLATTTISLDSSEVSDRRALWAGAMASFGRSPLLGVGRGNNIAAYPYDQVSGQTHNSYLGLLCELGVLGIAAYALLVGRIVAGLLRHRAKLPRRDRAPVLMLLAGLCAVGLSGMTISIENYRGLWLLLGLAAVYPRLFAASAGLALPPIPLPHDQPESVPAAIGA